MLQTLAIVGVIYLAILITLSLSARTKEKSSVVYLMAGSNLGAFLGFFTFAATLFSTFTLLGMPDFFRTHGVGAWIFLAVSDAFMVFGIIWLGYAFRNKAKEHEYYGMAGFMRHQFGSRLAGIVVFLGAFIFLIPYVAIQIRGVAIFLNAAFPTALPIWGWALAMVVVMLVYSEVGGLKAIIYSDTLQGILLLVAIWIVGIGCLHRLGGLGEMFDKVEASNAALLSVPGPNGLFDFQFLFGSMVAIVLLPFTQPQVSTRLFIMRSTKALYRMAIGLGVFAFLVILPTLFMGMYGALLYPEASTSEFLNQTFIGDQSNLIGALVMIGLVAAAISTSDSQVFALGGELRSLLKGDDQKMLQIARIGIGVFAVLALIFAVYSSDQLVLLARTSFAGTAVMAPMIFTGIFYSKANDMKLLPAATLVALLVLVISLIGWAPDVVLGIRLDLILLILLAVWALVHIGWNEYVKKSEVTA